MKKTSVYIVVILGLLLAVITVFIWKKGKNIRFVKKMGNGINIGNSLDSTGLQKYRWDADELLYETYWNNPQISKELFQTIYNAGFRTVRIPVTWEDHMNEDSVISQRWLNRVEEVVKMALDEGLYVILDTHHEKWLNLETDRETEISEKFKKVWTQIAIRFCQYNDHLLFEGMNEPRLRDSKYEWGSGTDRMKKLVNRLNTIFVNAVRSTGGNNQKRYLLICPYATNSTKEAMEALEIPKGHIIVSIHAYLPYNFCQNEEGTNVWNQDNPEDTKDIKEAFNNMNRLFVKKGIPVILTEFGCIDKDNMTNRIAWVRFYKSMAAKYGVPCIWWDNGSSFKILDREHYSWVYPKIRDVLTKNK